MTPTRRLSPTTAPRCWLVLVVLAWSLAVSMPVRAASPDASSDTDRLTASFLGQHDLPGFLQPVVESAYGSGVATAFTLGIPLAVVTLIAVVFLPKVELGTQNAVQRAAAQPAETVDVTEEFGQAVVETAEGAIGATRGAVQDERISASRDA